MTERPILMTPENAQQSHLGRKTQTRRLVNWPACHSKSDGSKRRVFTSRDVATMNALLQERQRSPLRQCCPYGQVGDRLWVREAFCVTQGNEVLYRGQCEEYPSLKPIWKRSLHMPRTYCRTVLELTDVRVERLQAISQLDALHEGCEGPDQRATFYQLWESIHGKGSWALNPWVWVIAFQKVTGNTVKKEAV